MDHEQLGLFYLGRPVDPSTGATQPEPFLLDARDLTTHAVCVGMTGSGKTGLCLGLLEEAAIDGIPVIAIDPKGDVGNLLLTFPSLDAGAFEPWVNPDDAARVGQSVPAFAAAEAEKWRTGLATWGQDGDRIRRLRAAVDLRVYTPGSRAATPLSILAALGAPPAAVLDDPELFGDRVAGTTASLLGLLGIDADPLTSRDHILVSTILSSAWQVGAGLDLATLIQRIQHPGVDRIGVMELEAFYSQKDRFALATRVNNLLAAPGFAAWLEGEPLDIGRLLRGPSGRPSVSVISIAHLDDAERMFVVSLLLNEIVSWMRAQPGTSSLRALVYMDEVFGYLPPTSNPASKRPLLTLLKQARAFGVGVCLATQNPVDLDYKALSNAGTWFIGRLQTERDRARLLDGLEGAAAGDFDRSAVEATLAGLGKRRFFVHNVHAKTPVVIESRWCLSYLRGPMTRDDLRRVSASSPGGGAEAAPPAVPPVASGIPPVAAQTAAAAGRPVLPADVPQFFAPAGGVTDGVWTPVLYGSADVDFADAKRGVEVHRIVTAGVPLTSDLVLVDWEQSSPMDVPLADLAGAPPVDATHAPLPAAASQAKSFARWSKEFDRWLSRSQRLNLWRHPPTRLVSAPDESERDFRIRVTEQVRAARDAAVDKVRVKYAPKLDRAVEKVRRAEMALGKEQQDVAQHRVQAGLSTASTIGSAVLGALFGRRGGMTAGTLGKASTAAKGWARGSKEAEDVKRAEQNLEAARHAQAELEQEIEAAVEQAGAATGMISLEEVALAPRRGGVHVRLVALVWVLSPRASSR